MSGLKGTFRYVEWSTVVDHDALICTDRKSLKKSFSNVALFLSFYVCVLEKVLHLHTSPFPSYPSSLCLSVSPQQGTDERSKVSHVEEAAFCRSHARASLHTHTHTRIHHIPWVLSLSWEPLQVLSKHAQISTWTQPQPRSWWASSRVALGHLWPSLCPYQSSSAQT